MRKYYVVTPEHAAWRSWLECLGSAHYALALQSGRIETYDGRWPICGGVNIKRVGHPR